MDFEYDFQVTKTFGVHARALLNDYSCFLEDIIRDMSPGYQVSGQMYLKMKQLKEHYIPANNIRAFPR